MRLRRAPREPITGDYQLLPELSDTAFEILKTDIRAHGVLVPIEIDDCGRILDGNHRCRAVRELAAEGVAVPCPAIVRAGLTEDQKVEHLLALNVARRHLSRAQRGDVVNLLRARGWSTTRIAAAVGVTHPTVLADLAAGCKDLQGDEAGTVIGGDGKRYPSRRTGGIVAASWRDARRALALVGEMQDPGEVLTVDSAAKRSRAARRERLRAATRDLSAEIAGPAGLFRTLVVDPPWDPSEVGDTDFAGWSAPAYATLSAAQLRELPIPAIAEPDCHLYVWATNRTLVLATQLIEAWGFRYITAITWCKTGKPGLGRYYRNNTEHVLFAVRGSLPLARTDVRTWFAAPRPGRHSAKPAEFYDLVETCSPPPRLELFAIGSRPGWSVWGAEAGSTD